jgi:hypothetical protein
MAPSAGTSIVREGYTTIDQVTLNQSFNLDQVQQLKVISVSEDSGLLKLKVVF